MTHQSAASEGSFSTYSIAEIKQRWEAELAAGAAQSPGTATGLAGALLLGAWPGFCGGGGTCEHPLTPVLGPCCDLGFSWPNTSMKSKKITDHEGRGWCFSSPGPSRAGTAPPSPCPDTKQIPLDQSKPQVQDSKDPKLLL